MNFTDVFFTGRYHQVFSFENNDSQSFGWRQVTKRNEQLRSAFIWQCIPHHIRPDIDSRPGIAAAKDILAIGQREMQVSDNARSWKSIVLANLEMKKKKKG